MANKVVAKPGVPAAKKQRVVKTSRAKVRSLDDARGYFAKKDTSPLNTTMFTNAKGELVVNEGLTEREKVQQGYLPPRVRRISFKKNEQEREEYKLVHTNAKGPTGGTPNRRFERKSTLIVHFINFKKQPDHVSTRAFKDVKESEIVQVISTFVKLRHDKDDPRAHVSKFYYAGKERKFNL